MATTTVNIRMDAETKRDMGDICERLGMSMSTAFNIFAKTLVREQRIPFEVTADPFYSSENLGHLRHSIAQLEAGRSHEHDLVGE